MSKGIVMRVDGNQNEKEETNIIIYDIDHIFYCRNVTQFMHYIMVILEKESSTTNVKKDIKCSMSM